MQEKNANSVLRQWILQHHVQILIHMTTDFNNEGECQGKSKLLQSQKLILAFACIGPLISHLILASCDSAYDTKQKHEHKNEF